MSHQRPLEPAADTEAAADAAPHTAQPHAAHTSDPDESRPSVVDYAATWRRLRLTLGVIGVAVLAVWLVGGILGDGPRLRGLAELLGIGLLVSFAVEAVVVGGSAVRGLLAAGERGDRLSSPDVSLLPPQVGRRRGDG